MEDAALPVEASAVVEKLRRHPSREQQVLGALRWVQDNIRYLGFFYGIHSHRPFPLDTVVSRRFGDCKDKSRLLAAMLRALGIECRIGLVSTADRHAIDNRLPAPSVFDHAVVGLVTEGGYQWLDATSSYQRGPLAKIYFPDYGWVLPLGDDSPGLVRVQPTGEESSRLETREHFTLPDYRGSASLTVTTLHHSGRADGARAYFASFRRVEIEKNYLSHYARLYPKVRQQQPLEVVDDDQATILSPAFLFTVKEASTDRSTTLTYQYLSRVSSVPAVDAERHYKDAQDALNQVGYTITVPASYATASIEELNQARAAGSELAVRGGQSLWSIIIAAVLGGFISLTLSMLAYFWDPRPQPAATAARPPPGLPSNQKSTLQPPP